MKIAIFGGSFNPPHLGHQTMLSSLCKLYDEVFVIPNATPHYKNLPENTASDLQRLEMCEIMCKNFENTTVIDFEVAKGGYSYTFATLEFLASKYPCDELFLAIGADSFLSIEKWVNFEKILKLATIYVFRRDDLELNTYTSYLKDRYNAKITISDNELVLASSTDFRFGLNEELVLPEMFEFIRKNKIYGGYNG